MRKYLLEYDLCRLDCDYLFDNIAIERKTFSDFLQSLYDKRLFNQLLKTKSSHERVILIIEGLIDPNFLTNPKIFYSTTQYITLKLGIPIVFSQSLENTAEVIKIAYSSENGIFYYRKIKIFPKAIPVAEKMLQCIEGIGPKKAKIIIKKYGSIANIIASEDCKADRINKKTVQKIQRVLKETNF